MITVINIKTLGVSEYDISDIIDIVSASGTTYYCTPSGIYILDDGSTESVTSTIQTGEVFFGDNSPKRYPHLEASCNVSGTDITVYSNIYDTDIVALDDTRHTEQVRGYRLPNIKRPSLELKIVGVDNEIYTISDLKVETIDTLVKK